MLKVSIRKNGKAEFSTDDDFQKFYRTRTEKLINALKIHSLTTGDREVAAFREELQDRFGKSADLSLNVDGACVRYIYKPGRFLYIDKFFEHEGARSVRAAYEGDDAGAQLSLELMHILKERPACE